MTARTGMATVIATLRSWTEAGSADYSVAGVTYWDDESLQAVLDRYRTDSRRASLQLVPEVNESNVSIYQDYYFDGGHWEEAGGGTAVWVVENSLGANIGTADYAVNYQAGHIRFTSDTAGSAYYLSGRQYDLYRAASEVWRRKAAHVAGRIDWKSDNHDIKASQLSKQYLAMAVSYEQQAPARFSRMRRVDINP